MKQSRAVLTKRSLPYLQSSIWQDVATTCLDVAGARENTSTCGSFANAILRRNREDVKHHRVGNAGSLSFAQRARKVSGVFVRKAYRWIRCIRPASRNTIAEFMITPCGIFMPRWISARPYLARLTRCRAIARRKILARSLGHDRIVVTRKRNAHFYGCTS